jgi:hypothetical protein
MTRLRGGFAASGHLGLFSGSVPPCLRPLALGGPSADDQDGRSPVKGDFHAGICGSPRVQSPRATMALAFAVLDLTGSPTDLGAVLSARTIALLAAMLAGGVVADRFSRRRIPEVVPREHVDSGSDRVAGNKCRIRPPPGHTRIEQCARNSGRAHVAARSAGGPTPIRRRAPPSRTG